MTCHRNLLLVCLVLFSLLFATAAQAQRSGRTAVAGAPSPKSVLGFNPGDDRKIADWSQITDYFSRLDQASNRVTVQTIGQSTLKRPMIAVFISARENIMALNKYKEIQRKL